MILHHWRPPSRSGAAATNFGDELNTLLWPRLLGASFFDDDPDVAFLGIGSLLGWPKDPRWRRRIVFGTGAASADAAVREPLDGTWSVYCVRGPSTARAYGFDPAVAVTDPAILVGRLFERSDPVAPFGYVPHLDEAVAWSHVLEPACERAGGRYIDPRAPVTEVIAAIGSVAVVVAEAMHGAITADALRVRWIPVHTALRPHRFKWTDWCRSMELDHRSRPLSNVARWAGRFGVRSARVEAAAVSRCAHELRRLVTSVEPVLSAPAVHADRLARFDVLLDRLRADVAADHPRR